MDKKEILDVKRIKDQNDRMKKWFEKRTNFSGFLFEQMAKVDEILSTTITKDNVCNYEITRDNYGLDIVIIECNNQPYWYDRDKQFWKYCPFCGGRIKIIENET